MGSYANASTLNSEPGKQLPCKRRHGTEASRRSTFIEQASPKVFAFSGYVFLAGPIHMPREIVRRLSGLMVEAGKTDRIQAARQVWHRRVCSRAHRVQELYDDETPIWVDAVSALGLAPE
jgi:hypothetical protein